MMMAQVKDTEAASQPREGDGVATVEDHNAAFDPADEALGGAFREGFREGWIYAQSPDGTDYDDLTEQFGRAVDIEPSEAWGAHRDKYFAMLPLAAIPEVGSPALAQRPPEQAVAVPAGWRDIASAPKDGSQVDLWVIFAATGARRWPDASWNSAAGEWQIGQYHVGQYGVRPEVTHWMTRPAAPTPPDAGSGSDGAGEVDINFEVWEDDLMVAGSTSEADARHYYAVYSQDGPVSLQKAVTTRTVLIPATQPGDGGRS